MWVESDGDNCGSTFHFTIALFAHNAAMPAHSFPRFAHVPVHLPGHGQQAGSSPQASPIAGAGHSGGTAFTAAAAATPAAAAASEGGLPALPSHPSPTPPSPFSCRPRRTLTVCTRQAVAESRQAVAEARGAIAGWGKGEEGKDGKGEGTVQLRAEVSCAEGDEVLRKRKGRDEGGGANLEGRAESDEGGRGTEARGQGAGREGKEGGGGAGGVGRGGGGAVAGAVGGGGTAGRRDEAEGEAGLSVGGVREGSERVGEGSQPAYIHGGHSTACEAAPAAATQPPLAAVAPQAAPAAVAAAAAVEMAGGAKRKKAPWAHVLVPPSGMQHTTSCV